MRKLASVLFIDVVGYSKRMGTDENGTLKLISQFQSDILNPYLVKHNGSLIKSMGDGWLAVFNDSRNSVICALNMRNKIINHPLDFRFGLNAGDIQIQNDDIYGDAANIAARLEQISSKNEVSISMTNYLSLDENAKSYFKSKGTIGLKNIDIPIPVWSTGDINEASSSLDEKSKSTSAKLVIKVVTSDKSIKTLGSIGSRYQDGLRAKLSEKTWTKSKIGEPGEFDFYVATHCFGRNGKVCFKVGLYSPQNASLWDATYAFTPSNILIEELIDEVSSKVLLKLISHKNLFIEHKN